MEGAAARLGNARAQKSAAVAARTDLRFMITSRKVMQKIILAPTSEGDREENRNPVDDGCRIGRDAGSRARLAFQAREDHRGLSARRIAPAKTPPEIVKRMHDELAKALKNPSVSQKLTEQGMDIDGGGPEVLDRFLRSEIARWAQVVKKNIRAGD